MRVRVAADVAHQRDEREHFGVGRLQGQAVGELKRDDPLPQQVLHLAVREVDPERENRKQFAHVRCCAVHHGKAVKSGSSRQWVYKCVASAGCFRHLNGQARTIGIDDVIAPVGGNGAIPSPRAHSSARAGPDDPLRERMRRTAAAARRRASRALTVSACARVVCAHRERPAGRAADERVHRTALVRRSTGWRLPRRRSFSGPSGLFDEAPLRIAAFAEPKTPS